jgi:hypothetical protein
VQVLLHLPDALAYRFKSAIPKRERSAFVADLLAKALPADHEDKLYLIAQAVESDSVLAEEMADWDVVSIEGLHDAH